ncbi:hypothetical protein [Streptoalloteichus hindustanus]|uniref:Abortive infection protein n=1 Tax=Streptoalloteichus hindustanus TaxID=2017 RepID=A0A1M5ET87_STRHI|nr:hypothetical protein [Streptoalloteichus hindustanus]SHF82465.1 hypothetical protein SAMN05444320_105127 [Streptoalloteichus hindustanus]
MTEGKLNRATFLRAAAVGGLVAAGAGLGGGAAFAGETSAGGASAGSASGRRWRAGVTYATGIRDAPGAPLDRPLWSRALMEQEINTIRHGLRCDSLVVFGSDVGRLTDTATAALERGMRVFVQPRLYDHPQPEILDHLAETARAVERLRRRCGDRVVLVVGCEFFLFVPGIVPGATFLDRIANLQKMPPTEFPGIWRRLDEFLRRAAAVARAHFHGPITYGSAHSEPVDWSLFDIIGVDYYEFFRTDEEYRKDLARYQEWKKPVVILEFGCCTYTGAPERGGMGWDGVIDWEAKPPRVKEGFVRDERTQADHIARMLSIFEAEDLIGAHVYTFISPDCPHSPKRELDFDLTTYSVVKLTRERYEDPASPYRIEPKESFRALARYNRR